jgi:hypothetical protein
MTASRPCASGLGILFALALGASSAARAQQTPPPPPSTDDLVRQIQSLQQQVKELQGQQARLTANPPFTAGDVDAAVGSVVRDADRRSKLLAETGGFYGGFLDDKFQIRSADGNFSLSPSVWFQFRQVTNYRHDDSARDKDQTDNGFEIRRAKLGFDGNAWGKDFYYNVVWATDRKTGNLLLEEAYARYQFAPRVAVKAGQYKELFAQETSASSRRKLAVDVSMVNGILFGGDTYTQGVELNYDDQDALQASLGFSDGYASFNTNFQDPPANPFDFGVYARAQYKLFGDWKSYADFTALGNKKDLLVVGTGADWSQNGDVNVIRHSIDVQWETGPLGTYGGFYGRYTDGAATGSTWDFGGVVQAGFLLNLQWEVFARYDFLKLEDQTNGEDLFHEVTVGLNYYIHKHNLKVTLDASWLPNGVPANQDAIGEIAEVGDDEFLLRAQLQFFI